MTAETQASYTPGPLEAQFIAIGDWVIRDPLTGLTVGTAHEGTGIGSPEANARLWADAPRLAKVNAALLEVLEQTTCWLCENRIGWTGDPKTGKYGDWRSCWACAPARAAIALARGGQS